MIRSTFRSLHSTGDSVRILSRTKFSNNSWAVGDDRSWLPSWARRGLTPGEAGVASPCWYLLSSVAISKVDFLLFPLLLYSDLQALLQHRPPSGERLNCCVLSEVLL